MSCSTFRAVTNKIREAYDALRSETGWEELPPLVNNASLNQWCVGRTEAKQHNSIPRVCWVRVDGSVVEADRLGPMVIEDDLSLSPLYGASTRVVCLVVGESDAQADLMWFGILRAARMVLDTAARPGNFTYLTQTERQAGLVNAGAEAIEQIFDWPFIVPKDWSRRVKLQSQHHDDRIASASGSTNTDENHPEE